MKKKTVVITGSTSGIGRGIALRLARDQHAIVLNYAHNDRRAQETLQLIKAMGTQVHLVKADIAKKADAVHLIEECMFQFGSIDVLINNAASVADKPVLEMSEAEWDQVIDVNLKGAFLCSQAAAAFMLEQEEGGLILNVGASTGIRARKNGINTCASKAGVMIMTQSLALELGPKVRANTIIPGLTYTEETEQRFHLDDPSVLQERTEQIPLRRIGTPEDIANVIALLLADEASFITGQKIVVDGGQYMW